MRIHKLLSSEGVLSRRKAEDYIRAGRVTVNGRKATIGQDVNPRKDIIAIDGVRVETDRNQRRRYIALNKPRGYVSTLTDELGRRCVADLVADVGTRVYPIGRLDRDSEGLLLFTNDGEFANLIMHPSRQVNKTYRVTIPGPVTEDQLIHLSTGVDLGEDGTTAPAQVDVLTREPGRTVLRITIHEGKNRQIRRMCEGVGLEVARLRRISVGPIRLGMLKPGTWRELEPREVGALRAAVKTPNIESIQAQKAREQGRPPRGAARGEKPWAKDDKSKKPGAKPYSKDGKPGKPYSKDGKPGTKPYSKDGKPGTKPYSKGGKPGAKPYTKRGGDGL